MRKRPYSTFRPGKVIASRHAQFNDCQRLNPFARAPPQPRILLPATSFKIAAVQSGYVSSPGSILAVSMNFGLGPGHRRRRHSTTWRDVITELGFRLSLGGGIMKGTVLIWKLLCFTYILALVRPVPEKIPIGKPSFIFVIP
ncbi:uncharacterized protein TNCV_4663632 [Trichonephila clavipes]|uniref:Uncharacterized protein n=1 Tax=Trichonephila clavipes TaxID=2585209 RepID=A0A8X6V8S8_TRICX|nr:uncharacterized protein TNCV_4663632 [Trichonephila clavipes]